MVLEPGDQGAEPKPQKKVVETIPLDIRRSRGPEAPEG